MLIRLLRTHVRPHGKAIAQLVLLQLAQTFAGLLLPALNADIIDNGVLKGDVGHIVRTGTVMIVVALLQLACGIGAVVASAGIDAALGRDLRGVVFRRVQDFSAREVGRFGTSSLIVRTTNDIQQVQTLVMTACTLGVPAAITGIGGIVMALRQDVPLSWLLVAIVPVLTIVLWLVVARMGPLYDRSQERLDQLNRVLREQISGVRVVRAFVRDAQEQKRFRRVNTELFTYSLRVGRLMAVTLPAVMLVANMCGVAVVWFGGHRVDGGHLGVGGLSAYLSYLLLITLSIIQAMFMVMSAPWAAVCARRIQEVLDTEPSVVLAATPVRPATVAGRLDIRAVTFNYPGAEAPVLRSVDLSVQPGQTVAIIGGTGSGKSTLLNLVPRLFDPTSGQVLIDGVDVRDLDPNVLSGTIGFVPQTARLFTGTVATNLRFGNPDATDPELWQALEVAQASEFVARMTRGLDTELGRAGTRLSGGQRQRLAIARALVRRPAIYLFDDSFSALDYATEANLRAALGIATSNAAVVVVAQRVSTIRNADHIVVLDRGRVVGAGTHPELLDSNPIYRAIVLSQVTEREAA